MKLEFDVEEAGCDSCAALVTDALEPLATVAAIEIDEEADRAHVTLDAPDGLAEDAVAAALAEASEGVGHAYRVRPGSWRTAG